MFGTYENSLHIMCHYFVYMCFIEVYWHKISCMYLEYIGLISFLIYIYIYLKSCIHQDTEHIYHSLAPFFPIIILIEINQIKSNDFYVVNFYVQRGCLWLSPFTYSCKKINVAQEKHNSSCQWWSSWTLNRSRLGEREFPNSMAWSRLPGFIT